MDSRLATEAIFDSGLGDLFNIRIAGNVVSDQGHGPPCDNLGAIVEPIAVSVRAETETSSDRVGANEAFVRKVTVMNVRRSMEQVRERSGTLRKLIDEGKIQLVGGIYDVSTRKVEFLDPA